MKYQKSNSRMWRKSHTHTCAQTETCLHMCLLTHTRTRAQRRSRDTALEKECEKEIGWEERKKRDRQTVIERGRVRAREMIQKEHGETTRVDRVDTFSSCGVYVMLKQKANFSCPVSLFDFSRAGSHKGRMSPFFILCTWLACGTSSISHLLVSHTLTLSHCFVLSTWGPHGTSLIFNLFRLTQSGCPIVLALCTWDVFDIPPVCLSHIDACPIVLALCMWPVQYLTWFFPITQLSKFSHSYSSNWRGQSQQWWRLPSLLLPWQWLPWAMMSSSPGKSSRFEGNSTK